MFKTCPDPVDVQDLQFKLHCKLKIFNNKELEAFPKLHYDLVSCASRYGLLFVGSHSSNLQVIQLKCVETYSPKDKDISNYPRRNVALPSRPQHICINCDSTILAIVTEKDNCPVVTFYDVLSFLKQNISIIKEVRLSASPGISVKEIGWNPALPSIFTACKTDGTLGVYEITGNSISINELPAASEATCFCWSPKGKQIAVGSKNGRITQYKPDLKAVKVINQPPIEGAFSLISLQWVSNYQFIGIYQSMERDGPAKLIVVDAPKTGDPVYTNYEDVCYSGSTRSPQFYMILEHQWNLLMVASSNSTELGVLGNNGEIWTQWIISDSARAELPLSSDHQETLPVGLALDISSTQPLPWNESSIPPCPYLLILSHYGVLCLFNIVNLKEGIPSICTPPDPISDLSGIQQFVTSSESTPAPQIVNLPKTEVPSIANTQTPVTTNQAPVFGAKVLPQPQATYTAPVGLFGNKPSDSKPLFGGQVTLTPIKPQQPTTQSLFGGQTLITPINKQQSVPPVTATTSEKYSTILSALNTTVAAPPLNENKPIVITSQSVQKPTQVVEQQPVQLKIPQVKPPEPLKSAVNLKIKEETDVLLTQMLRDECSSLEYELKALVHQGRLLNVNIGSDNEKVELVRNIESLQEFIKEIIDISIGENAEVHYLKQNLIQSWAWFEEARSRYNASKDETVALLLRSQPLDSATEKRQADIRKAMYYIESQITQASKALDEQWDNFQDYAKKVHRTKMPTMETIFQAMVRQNVILQKQTYILKDIANRLKGKGRGPNVPSLLLSMGTTEDLEDSLNRLKIDHPQDIYQLQYERVLNRMKNLSEAKSNKLRNLLKTREVPHVTAVKLQLSSSLMLQSPESKSKRLLSNLAASGMAATPLSNAKAGPRALSFVHSTPIRETKTDIKPTETPPNTPQLDPKPFIFKKVEKSNLPTSNSFIPVSKSASVFNSPQEGLTQAPLPTHTPSAFVPTQVSFGGTGKLFNFSSVSTPTSSTPATTTFSFGPPTLALPKFGTNAIPKTPDACGDIKTSLPQFNIGALSITPVTSKKDISTSKLSAFSAVSTSASSVSLPVATGNVMAKNEDSVVTKPSVFATSSTVDGGAVKTTITSSVTTAASIKPTFSFGSAASTKTPSLFGSNTTTTSANTVVATSQPAFGNIAVTSKPSIFQTESPSMPSEFSFGTMPQLSVPKTAKQSLPPANVTSTVSSGVSVVTITTATSAQPTLSVSDTVSNESLFSGTPQSTGLNLTMTTTTSSTPVSVTKPSIFGNINLQSSASQQSIFGGIGSQSLVGANSQNSSIFGATTSTTSQSTATFGGVKTTSTTQPSIFAAAIAASTAPSSLFGSTPSEVSSTQTNSSPGISTSAVTFSTSGTPKTATSIYGNATTTTTQSSIFGISPANVTTRASIFSVVPTTSIVSSQQEPNQVTQTAATQSSIFATQSLASAVSSTTQSTSIFGSAKAPAVTSQSSVFSTVQTTRASIFGTTQTTTPAVTTAAQTSSIFAAPPAKPFDSAAVPKTTASSIFGSVPATTTQSSVFGVSSASTSTPSVFGATPGTNQSSPFGTTTATSSQQGSIFGGGVSSTMGSIFGAATLPASTQTSIFGGAKPASSTTSSVFGNTQMSTAQSSIFGASTTPSTQASVFGTPAATSASPFGSVFGAPATSSAPFGQGGSVFGAPSTTASTFSSGFGSPAFSATPSTTSSVFGQPTTFGTSSPPAFGTPTTSANIFGSTSATFGATTSANVFGSPPASTSSFSFASAASNPSNTAAFGFGSLNVGSSTTASSAFNSSTTFGQTTTANPFSRAVEQKSPFGGGSTSIFGTPASSSGSIFGSNTGSTFSSNTQGGFGNSSFASPPAFGQPAGFGQTSFGSSSFGSVQPGPFSGGSGAVAQTGFGSPSNFGKPSGFGSPPAFGASPQPAFGAAPSFGSAPAFGSASTFGSPNKIFGSSAPTAAFGSSTAGSPGFGNLANQNTVGFGTIAQQAAAPNPTPFSGSSSFSTWR